MLIKLFIVHYFTCTLTVANDLKPKIGCNDITPVLEAGGSVCKCTIDDHRFVHVLVPLNPLGIVPKREITTGVRCFGQMLPDIYFTLRAVPRNQMVDLEIHQTFIPKLISGIFDQFAPKRLIFEGCRMNEVVAGALDHLAPNLKILSLRNNKMKRVWRGVLDNLIHLEYLDLSANRFERLNDRVTGNLGTLKFLNLSHNQVHDIECSTFAELTNLEYLDLSHNKLADDLTPCLFRSLNKLQFLDVSYNSIEQLPAQTLESLPNLMHLRLSHNLLHTITLSISLTNLMVIDLDKNDISSLGSINISNSSSRIDSVKIISLAGNNIVNVDDKEMNHFLNIFNRIESLDLRDNLITDVELGPILESSINNLNLANNILSSISFHDLKMAHVESHNQNKGQRVIDVQGKVRYLLLSECYLFI